MKENALGAIFRNPYDQAFSNLIKQLPYLFYFKLSTVNIWVVSQEFAVMGFSKNNEIKLAKYLAQFELQFADFVNANSKTKV